MVIQLLDGKPATVLDVRDMLALIDKHMGYDARVWLEEYLAAEHELEEIEILQDKRIAHYRTVIRELRTHAEKLAGLIQEKELNRVAISHEAGQIGVITGRELR